MAWENVGEIGGSQSRGSRAHLPVMPAEVLFWLKPRSPGIYLDCTVGHCGHALDILRASAPDGKVIGIDMTEAMISRARINAEKLNFHNVEFRLGEIETMPVSSGTADVIVSNCVLNLVPDKKKAFGEIYRTLKEGGHFSISDIVLEGLLPEKIIKTAEMYAGCVSGAIQKENYLDIIRETGFQNITVQKERGITVPDEILKNYLSEEEIGLYKKSGAGIFSITVYAEKPKEKAACCDSTCCS